MPIMSFEDWKRDTKLHWYNRRSRDLDTLDTALADYHRHGGRRDDLIALNNAFRTWAATKGHNGDDSKRNGHNAVAHLREQIDAALLAFGLVGQGPVQPLGQHLLHRHRVAPSATATRVTMTDDDVVSAYTSAAKLLWTASVWNSKTKAQRGAALVNAVIRAHTLCGIPAVTPDVKALPDGYLGFFDSGTWSIQLAENVFDFAFSTANRAQFVRVCETVYHEARHCEQWFHMARYYALGRSALDIQDNLGIGKQTVCQEAKRRAMSADDKMYRLAKTWFESVYGTVDREIVLTALGLREQTSKVNAQYFRGEIDALYRGNLPEEVDAWAIQDLVRAKF